MTKACRVLIDDLDVGLLASKFGHIPGDPGQMLAVRAGSAAHNLPVYDKVDRCFGRARMGRAIGSQELVRIDMTPSA